MTSTIHRLSEDILSHIFIEGAKLDRLERQRVHKRSAQPLNLECQEFRDIVTWVCCHWRSLALRTTLLWAYIDLSDGPPYVRSRRFLARSGDTQPLDINLNIDRQFMAGLLKNDYVGHTERLVEALSFIINNGGDTVRWRSFSAKTTAAIVVDDINYCLYGEPLPNLEFLSLIDCYRSTSDYETPDGGIDREEPYLKLFENQPPQLRSLQLRRFDSRFLLNPVGDPIVSNVTFIDLGLVGSEPPLTGIHLLLARNPSLRTLRLNMTRVRPDFDELNYGQNLKPVSLLSLQELFLTNPHSSLWGQQFLLMINAPILHYFRLYLHYSYSTFYGMLKIFVDGRYKTLSSCRAGKTFPSLKHFSTNIRSEWLEEVLCAYPELNKLTLLPRHSQNALLLLSQQPWLVPNLKGLKISSCPPDAHCLLQTAKARSNAQIPLQSIEIGRLEFKSLLFEEKMGALEKISGRTSLYYPNSDEDSGSDGYDGYEWKATRSNRRNSS
ncbi:hypothetical protein RhiJN_28930 [Ceratobasidium sp. AG-Ba]|nr:hypothetical protein RhiJN_28930 [Ceratobasidium sp. AG-Ba]